MDPAEAKKVSELVEELVLVCKDSSQAAALFHENLQELWPTLQGASSHTLPKVLLHNVFFSTPDKWFGDAQICIFSMV